MTSPSPSIKPETTPLFSNTQNHSEIEDQEMQQAIPYNSGRTWMPPAANDGISTGRRTTTTISSSFGSDLVGLVKDNPVLVLGRRGCCMIHVVRRLLLGLGVNPVVRELDDDRNDEVVVEELKGLIPPHNSELGLFQQQIFPAVFIGGRHVGGIDRLMAAHITGDLVPKLKDAGALWL